jgi:signal transduction histidine kinase
MTDEYATLLRPLMRRQLMWVMSLRWWACGAMIVFDGVQAAWGPYFRPAGLVASVGVVSLVLNAGFIVAVRRDGDGERARRRLVSVAWAQLVADLVALTVIVLLTGGLSSPALGFYVFPMIFASLFLSRSQAYAGALLAIVMFTVSLAVGGRWPETGLERMTAIGWVLTLFVSVHLVNRVTRGLFKRERERLRQERRLHEMNERLDAQEQAMRHHEKLVSIGQLAAGVAHEISNPLASMDGLLQLMQRSPDKPRPEAVAKLREQVARISGTLRHMTSLSHPDLGEPETVDVNALVTDTVEILGYDRRLRRIEIRLDLDGSGPRITARPRALQQVLMNLVFNAADAVQGVDGPSIGVRTRADGHACKIEVADNGQGIDERDRERIFDAFVTTKPEGQGTGLGLPISRDLVVSHGGSLTFANGEGGGVVFTVRVPREGPGRGDHGRHDGSQHTGARATPSRETVSRSPGAGQGTESSTSLSGEA